MGTHSLVDLFLDEEESGLRTWEETQTTPIRERSYPKREFHQPGGFICGSEPIPRRRRRS